jgi:hypothetical protein
MLPSTVGKYRVSPVSTFSKIWLCVVFGTPAPSEPKMT